MAETEAERKLAMAALQVTAPDPKSWVQKAQIWLAFVAMAGALFLAGWLIIHGPPSPKTATAEVTEMTTTTKPGGEPEVVETSHEGVVGNSLDTGQVAEKEEGSKGEEEANSGESSGEGESLANLSKQGPWAFVIVALLAAVFLATGKSLNVGGTPQTPETPETGGRQ